MTTRPTPETDAVVDRTSLCPDNNESCMAAAKLLTSLARQLERDYAALWERVAELEKEERKEYDRRKWAEELLRLIRDADGGHGAGAKEPR